MQAVQEQMAKGVHYGENHKLEVEWAELIKSMMPMAERVEFCSCGQEANLMADKARPNLYWQAAGVQI